jgi:hypothetical protein
MLKRKFEEDAHPAPETFAYYFPFLGLEINQKTVVGQALRGKAKKRVFLPENQEWAFKGPFTAAAVEKVIKRGGKFHALGDFIAMDYHVKTSDDGSFFLVSNNISETPREEWDIQLVSNKVMAPSYVATGASRGVYGLADVETITPEQAGYALHHLVARYLLGIGDSGPQNIVVTKSGALYGLDYEEDRGTVPITGTLPELLFAKKVHRRVIEKLLTKEAAAYSLDLLQAKAVGLVDPERLEAVVHALRRCMAVSAL